MSDAPPEIRLDHDTLVVASPDAMRRLGELIGGLLEPGDVVLLDGDLGAGKTTLAQGIGRGLGIPGAVQSPTFTLVNEHRLAPPLRGIAVLHHVDLYRLGNGDLTGIGFDELLDVPDAVAVVEWPERAVASLPPDYVVVAIEEDDGGRRVRVVAADPRGRAGRLANAILRAAIDS